jgi:hypothetical protein
MIKHIACRERPFSAYINSRQEGGHWYKPFTQYDQDYIPKKPGSSSDAFPSGERIKSLLRGDHTWSPLFILSFYSKVSN